MLILFKIILIKMAELFIDDLIKTVGKKKTIFIENLIIENTNKHFKVFWNKDEYSNNRWTMKITKHNHNIGLNKNPTGHVSDSLKILYKWSDSLNIEELYYGF